MSTIAAGGLKLRANLQTADFRISVMLSHGEAISNELLVLFQSAQASFAYSYITLYSDGYNFRVLATSQHSVFR